MKKRNLFLGAAMISLAFISCKDAKLMQAEESVDTYIAYVDSISNVKAEEASENWESIKETYQIKVAEAEAALDNLKERQEAQTRINTSMAKYESIEDQMRADMKVKAMATSKQQLRNTLFGEGKIGDDMDFTWVNKDNILPVYNQFVNTVADYKDSYSREDWDEIKLMYEALDSRKNTVENEGLSSKDNREIAGLKLKFAPMYTINRMGAKNEEMQKAKN